MSDPSVSDEGRTLAERLTAADLDWVDLADATSWRVVLVEAVAEWLRSEQVRDMVRDEAAGWPIGSGYYSTAVGTDEARDLAGAILDALARLAVDA